MTKPRLLIVDDDAAQQLFYLSALSGYNLEIDVSSDGWQALRKVSGTQYDLIFLDMAMPKMSGIDFLSAVSDMPNVVLPLTIVISSLSQKEKMMEALSLGASAYLLKPVEVAQLKSLVEDYLGAIAPASPAADVGTYSSKRPLPQNQTAFTAENTAKTKQSQFDSLTKAMATMVFQKITATLVVETQLGTAELNYYRGKLRHVKFLNQTGIDALETLRKLPPISITLAP
ncbi:MAG: response regulator [Chloroherpetonaceae bacterium]|nr:response regulator [Chloroherpetonaceae bacterium]MCS7210840.1 response regulator [Chloroherpetonaceae bacterium]MDW8020709.1 response regulator [Chloroherpetonaceae bacterium]